MYQNCFKDVSQSMRTSCQIYSLLKFSVLIRHSHVFGDDFCKTELKNMVNLRKELEKCKHPNSRKTKALGRKARRQNNKHKIQLSHAIKSNIVGEKLSWFLGHFDENRSNPLTPEEFEELILLYFKRFDEELEQIALKQAISKNRANQHVSRQNVINITLEKERNEYNGGGMEMLNLCDPVKFKSLVDWDGSALNVQHLKMDLISRNMMQRLKKERDAKENRNKMETID